MSNVKNRELAEAYGVTVREAAAKCGPMPGDFAICSLGYLGIITSETPVMVDYMNGDKGQAWTGINLTQGMEGTPWSSRNPRVVASRRSIVTGVNGVSVAVTGMVRGTMIGTLDANAQNLSRHSEIVADVLGDGRKIVESDFDPVENSVTNHYADAAPDLMANAACRHESRNIGQTAILAAAYGGDSASVGPLADVETEDGVEGINVVEDCAKPARRSCI